MKFSSIHTPWSDQRVITRMETGIVLIAFVAVSSVFSFAALSTGLFSSDKAKETHAAGLTEARGTSELKGSVVAEVSGTTGVSGVVTGTEFQISNATAGEFIDLTPGNTVNQYSDNAQAVAMNPRTGHSASNKAASAIATPCWKPAKSSNHSFGYDHTTGNRPWDKQRLHARACTSPGSGAPHK